MHWIELYRRFAESTLAMPVVAGEKPEHERFPGAVNTYSIEAMMQDGKALQAGTSHYLGTHFAKAQNIKYQDRDGTERYCHTTSWGLSTRMIGGLIMTHGDDDGLRCPPAVAPKQIVVVPMLRGKPEDAAILSYCDKLRSALAQRTCFSAPIRAIVDTTAARSAEKRWNWVRRGAPIICEIGNRDASAEVVTFMRRDRLRAGDKVASQALPLGGFVERAPALLLEIQNALFEEAALRLRGNIRTDIGTLDELEAFFGPGKEDDDKAGEIRGWVRCSWSRPT